MKKLFINNKIIIIIIFINKIQNSNPIFPQDIKNRKLENDIFIQINNVRTNPQKYLKNIVEKEKSSYATGDNFVGFNELVLLLKNQKPLWAMKKDLGLKLSAYYHSNWMKRFNKFSHTGENNSSLWERIERFGENNGVIGENIFSGSINSTIIILDYLVDGGIPNRGHRKNILNEKFKQVGIGSDETYSTINFASNFTDEPGLNSLPGTPLNEIVSSIIIKLFLELLLLLYLK